MSRADELRVRDYLGHILEAIKRIDRYVDNMNDAEFRGDDKTQDAVIRNFEIIGEACRNVERHHPEYAAKYPEVPWSIAYEMRNALAHGYFLVDMEVVWRTIHNDLPGMAEQVQRLLQAE
jgi:uncharacterized protein with HEPN domain